MKRQHEPADPNHATGESCINNETGEKLRVVFDSTGRRVGLVEPGWRIVDTSGETRWVTNAELESWGVTGLSDGKVNVNLLHLNGAKGQGMGARDTGGVSSAAMAETGGGGKAAKTATAATAAAVAYTAAQYMVGGSSLPQDALWNEAPPNTKGASNTQPWAAHAKDSAGDCSSGAAGGGMAAAQYVAGGSLPQDSLWNEAPLKTKRASNTQPWAAHAGAESSDLLTAYSMSTGGSEGGGAHGQSAHTQSSWGGLRGRIQGGHGYPAPPSQYQRLPPATTAAVPATGGTGGGSGDVPGDMAASELPGAARTETGTGSRKHEVRRCGHCRETGKPANRGQKGESWCG